MHRAGCAAAEGVARRQQPQEWDVEKFSVKTGNPRANLDAAIRDVNDPNVLYAVDTHLHVVRKVHLPSGMSERRSIYLLAS